MRDAYRDNLNGWQPIKSAYDPDNLFRVNRNIRPGHSGPGHDDTGARGTGSDANPAPRPAGSVGPPWTHRGEVP